METPLTNDSTFQTDSFQESVKFDLNGLEKSALDFLAMSNIVNPQGEVFSWLNANHQGYVYPEIMGYYLTFGSTHLARASVADPLTPLFCQRIHRVAQRLQQLVSPVGGIGKAGYIYLFDTAVAITGLLAYHRHLKGVIDEACLLRMVRFMERGVEQHHSVFMANGDRAILSPHWSTVFGSSMVKCAIAFNRVADWTAQDHYRQLGQDCVTSVMVDYCNDGAFTAGPYSDLVYTHAHCYALEGLLDLQSYGINMMSDLIAGADWLERWQNLDGSLLNWNSIEGGHHSEGDERHPDDRFTYGCYSPDRRDNEPPSGTFMVPPSALKIGDATAQAIRIWIAVDSDRYHRAICRGFQFLHRLVATHNGLYYGLGSGDVNAWVTMFTAQALAWYLRGTQARDLV